MTSIRPLQTLIAMAFLLAACAPGSAPASTPVPPSPTAAAVQASTSTPAPAPTTQPSPVPTTPPAAAPTTAPTAAPATPAPGPTAMPLECLAGPVWSQTQADASLSICFDPYPPKLGTTGSYTALLVDNAGQPIAEAEMELTLVGAMAGMAGEHDEDFALEMASQGAGLYAAQGSLGPSDLVLNGVVIRIRSGRDLWSFSIPADALAGP